MVIYKRGRKENREWEGEIYLMENISFIVRMNKRQKAMGIKQKNYRKINS